MPIYYSSGVTINGQDFDLSGATPDLGASGNRLGTVWAEQGNYSDLLVTGGNLGIGTDNPIAPLHFVGELGTGARAVVIDGQNGSGDVPLMIRAAPDPKSATDDDHLIKLFGNGNLRFVGTWTVLEVPGTGTTRQLAVRGHRSGGGLPYSQIQLQNLAESDTFSGGVTLQARVDGGGSQLEWLVDSGSDLVERLRIESDGETTLTGNLSLRNGLTPTEWSIHSTYTDPDDWERLRIYGDGSNYFLASEAGPSGGVKRPIYAVGDFGGAGDSSTQKRPRWSLNNVAVDNTDATRKYRAVMSVYDTAAREAWRAEADGSRGYLIQKAHATAPGDTMLPNASLAFYADGSGNLAIKLKDSGGTVRTGSVTLS